MTAGDLNDALNDLIFRSLPEDVGTYEVHSLADRGTPLDAPHKWFIDHDNKRVYL